MVRVHRFVPLACLLVLAACDGPSFEVGVEATTTVQGSALGQLLNLPGFSGFSSFDFAQSSDFRNAGYPKDQIGSVKLKSLTLEITAPPTATFDFLDAIAFDVEAPGQPRQRVATLASVPKGQRTLSLALHDVELAPYVKAETLSLTTDAQGRPPPQDTTIRGVAVFDVVPKLF